MIGHRGASGHAPENTLESFALAVEQGAEAVELDVRRSADGEAMVIHDATLDRTTDARGAVATLAREWIQAADAGFGYSDDGGASFPWRGRGVRVPSLRDLLERFPALPLLIELKEAEVAEPVRRLLLEHEAAGRCVVASADEAALAPFRDPRFLIGGSRRTILQLWLRALAGLGAPRSHPHAYSVPDYFRDMLHVPTPGFIRAAREAGSAVHVWTVNDPARAVVLWRRGACGMITNYPAVLREARERAFGAPGG